MIILNRSYLQKHDGATSRAGTLVLWIVVCPFINQSINQSINQLIDQPIEISKNGTITIFIRYLKPSSYDKLLSLCILRRAKRVAISQHGTSVLFTSHPKDGLVVNLYIPQNRRTPLQAEEALGPISIPRGSRGVDPFQRTSASRAEKPGVYFTLDTPSGRGDCHPLRTLKNPV
jgi:hypothetical protein